jgi:hypothetical protein
MISIDYKRLSYLGNKVKTGSATKKEKDEFMLMLFRDEKITAKQYDDYVSNRNVEDIINGALAIGAVVLIGYLLKELLK